MLPWGQMGACVPLELGAATICLRRDRDAAKQLKRPSPSFYQGAPPPPESGLPAPPPHNDRAPLLQLQSRVQHQEAELAQLRQQVEALTEEVGCRAACLLMMVLVLVLVLVLLVQLWRRSQRRWVAGRHDCCCCCWRRYCCCHSLYLLLLSRGTSIADTCRLGIPTSARLHAPCRLPCVLSHA